MFFCHAYHLLFCPNNSLSLIRPQYFFFPKILLACPDVILRTSCNASCDKHSVKAFCVHPSNELFMMQSMLDCEQLHHQYPDVLVLWRWSVTTLTSLSLCLSSIFSTSSFLHKDCFCGLPFLHHNSDWRQTVQTFLIFFFLLIHENELS